MAIEEYIFGWDGKIFIAILERVLKSKTCVQSNKYDIIKILCEDMN